MCDAREDSTNGTDDGDLGEDPPAFPVPLILGLSALGLIGTMANTVTLAKVTRSFDTRRTCFFLAYADVVACTTCTAIFTVSTLVANLITRDVFSCSVMYLSLYISHLIGVIITTQVSVLRYHLLRLTRRNECLDDNWAKKFCLRILVGYVALYLFLRWVFDIETATQCICRGVRMKTKLSQKLVKAITPLPALCPIVSIFFDVRLIRLLKSVVGGNSENGNDKDFVDSTIPVRATIYSAVMAFLYMGMAAMWASTGMDVVSRSSAILVISAACMAVRCSVMTRETFTERKKTREARKEERQAMEMEQARASRELRTLTREDRTLDQDLAAVRALTQRARRHHQHHHHQQQRRLSREWNLSIDHDQDLAVVRALTHGPRRQHQQQEEQQQQQQQEEEEEHAV